MATSSARRATRRPGASPCDCTTEPFSILPTDAGTGPTDAGDLSQPETLMFKRTMALGVGLAASLGAGLAGAQNANGPFVQNATSLAETAKAEALIAKDPASLSDVG